MNAAKKLLNLKRRKGFKTVVARVPMIFFVINGKRQTVWHEYTKVFNKEGNHVNTFVKLYNRVLEIRLIDSFCKPKNSKYKRGDFGYWWTVTLGKEDIRDTIYPESIDCKGAELKSLYGAPGVVRRIFDCSCNDLTTLEHGPGGAENYFCNSNNLISLKGSPKFVGGLFDCSKNDLTSLKHGPIEVMGDFWCDNNPITTLEFAPKFVGRSFCASFCALVSLKGCSRKIFGDFDISSNPLSTLEYCPTDIGGDLFAKFCNIDTLKFMPKSLKGDILMWGNPPLKNKDFLAALNDLKFSVRRDGTSNFEIQDFSGRKNLVDFLGSNDMLPFKGYKDAWENITIEDLDGRL